jgi:hypothetical protein
MENIHFFIIILRLLYVFVVSVLRTVFWGKREEFNHGVHGVPRSFNILISLPP